MTTLKRNAAGLTALAFAAFGVSGTGSCTALLEVPPQCERDDDCSARGFDGARCVANACVPASSAGGGGAGGGAPQDRWACLGHVEFPPIQSPELTYYTGFVDGNGDPIVGQLRVRVCNELDLPCANPIRDNLTPDADGLVTYTLSGLNQGHYVEIQGPQLECCAGGGDACCSINEIVDSLSGQGGGGGGGGGSGADLECCGQTLVPALLFDGHPVEPLPGPGEGAPVTMVTRLAAALTIKASGFAFQEDSAGIALGLATDCNGDPVAGVRIVPESTESTAFYFQGLIPDPDLPGTQDQGNSGVLNVPAHDANNVPGPAHARLTAERVSDGAFIGVTNYIVRPGWFSNIVVEPTPN